MRYVAASGRDAGGCTPGATALLESMQYLGGFGSKGCYNYRRVRGSRATFSVHGDGRAIDVAVDAWHPDRAEVWTPPAMSWGTPAVADPRLVARMHEWCDFLISHHAQLGIQLIIFWTRIWTCERAYWRPYSGSAGPHYDHAHIEVHPDRAGDLTAAEIFKLAIPRFIRPTPVEEDGMLPTIWRHEGDNVVLKEGDGPPVHVHGMETLAHLRGRGCPEVFIVDRVEWNRKRQAAGFDPLPDG